MVSIAIWNSKGGVGKSMTCFHLGCAFAEMGLNVCMVDYDPLGSLSILVDERGNQLGAPLYDFLFNGTPIKECIYPYTRWNFKGKLDFIPTNQLSVACFYAWLNDIAAGKTTPNKFDYLQRVIITREMRKYDIVLVDGEPGASFSQHHLLNAVDFVIIPEVPDFQTLHGLVYSLDILTVLSKEKILPPEILFVLPVRQNKPTNTTLHERDAERAILEVCAKYRVNHYTDSHIYETVKYKDAVASGLPLWLYDPRHDFCDAYRNVAYRAVLYLQGGGPIG